MMPTADPAEALWQLWSLGQKPDLGVFLAKVGPLTLSQLAEVVRVDQRQRWQAGEPVKAETFFRQFPELDTDPDLAVDLIFNEFLLREKLGQRPELEEYARRFPSHAAVLKDQIELHRALGTESRPLTLPSPLGGEGGVSGRPGHNTDFSPAPSDKTPFSTLARAERPASTASLPETFGRYRIVKSLGQGGMGTVYLAHDSQLHRQVALKVPRFNGSDDVDLVARFGREARIAATFHHPNLCPVYDVGEIQGTPYLTMPFLAGEPLSEYLKRKTPLPQATACRLALLVARAMHVAHQAGVRHRDLKPSNIMIQEGLQPVVMDFGLARRDGGQDPRLTATGQLMGTCAYMPPEQIASGTIEIEPASDVYSLGVILYEMLTGRLPFQGPAHEILRAVLTEPAPSPRQFRPDVDPVLESICMKTLAKSANDRFLTMAELATALEPFAGTIERKPDDTDVIAPPARREPRPPERKSRAGIVAVVGIGAVFLGVGLWLVFFPPNQTRNGDPGQAAATTKAELTQPAKTDATSAKAEVSGKKGGSPVTLNGHTGAVHSLAFNPVVGKELVSGSQDGTIRFWDVTTGKDLATWKGTAGSILSVAFSPNGKQVVSGGGDEGKLIWDVLLWDVAGGRITATLPGHSYFVSAVAFSPDGKLLASGAGDNAIRVWDLTKGKDSTLLEGHTIWVRALAFSPKGKVLASGSDDETVRLWDLTTGKNTATLKGHERPVLAVAFSPDGRTVASGSEEKTIRLWEVATGKNTATFKGHEGPVHAVAFSPDGKQLVSGGADHKVKLWNIADAKCTATLEGHNERVNAVAFSPDGRTIASGSQDQTINAWDVLK